MERIDHVHIVEIGGGGLIGQIHRMLQRQVPDGERLILGVACGDAPAVVVVQLAQTGGHFAAAGAGGRHHDQGPRRLDIVVAAQSLVGDDMGHVGGISGDGIVPVALDTQRVQPLDEGIRRRLPGVLGDDHGAYIEPQIAEHVDEPQHIGVVADAQIAPHLVLFDVPGADGHHDLHVVLQRPQHPDLAVRLEARQHPGRMVVVEQLAAELQIQLAAELGAPRRDVLRLQLQVLVVVKTDLHLRIPRNSKTRLIIQHPASAEKEKSRISAGKNSRTSPLFFGKTHRCNLTGAGLY